MLVVSRKAKEDLPPGDNKSILLLADGTIEIHILRLECGNVKLGVVAPRDISVVRKEIECKG